MFKSCSENIFNISGVSLERNNDSNKLQLVQMSVGTSAEDLFFKFKMIYLYFILCEYHRPCWTSWTEIKGDFEFEHLRICLLAITLLWCNIFNIYSSKVHHSNFTWKCLLFSSRQCCPCVSSDDRLIAQLKNCPGWGMSSKCAYLRIERKMGFPFEEFENKADSKLVLNEQSQSNLPSD